MDEEEGPVTRTEIIEALSGSVFQAANPASHWVTWVRVRSISGERALVCVSSENPYLVGDTVSLSTLERGVPDDVTLEHWRRLPPVAGTTAAAGAEH